MAAVILVKVVDSAVPDAPGKWYRAQLVAAVEQAAAAAQHFFGFTEMPVRSDQPITVQALNNRDPNSYKKFTSFRMLNEGTITVGLNNLPVVTDDIVVRQESGIFSNFSNKVRATSTAADDRFYQFTVTDFTLQDAQQYVQPVEDTTDPENPVLVSRSKYRITQAGMDALAANDGFLEGVWADFDQYFEDQYP